MADEVEEVPMNPSKRMRLSSRLNSDNYEYDGDLTCFSRTIEYNSVTPVSSEGTLTSDSGYNDFTPPRLMDEELANNQVPSCSSATQMSIESNTSNKLALSDDDSTMDSTVSDCSGISSISNFSGQEWKPCAGRLSWVERQMLMGQNPRAVLSQMLGGTCHVPQELSNSMLWHAIVSMMSEVPKREKLRHINTIDDVVRLIKVCRKVIILTGAGVSVSCGIPDFRSKDGIYARLAADFPSLPDPQAMFDISYFRKDPRPFFKFAREIYPGQFTPSLCHKFISFTEDQNKLLRNYTQNIDTLEQVAGINNIIQCHGSFATATCQTCKHKVSSNVIKEDIFNQVIPKCTLCAAKEPINNSNTPPQSNILSDESGSINYNSLSFTSEGSPIVDASESVMKPDIVFFGEGLSDEFHDKLAIDKDECDLLIVIGSSLKVRPVALIPSSLPSNVPQILINREPLSHLTFDVELLGNCDVIVSELCRRLGGKWQQLSVGDALSEIEELPPRVNEEYSGDRPVEDPHPKDESDIEALRACWKPKIKESVAARLPDGKFLFNGRHRYVFPGAEVYYDPDDEDDSSSSDTSLEDFEGSVQLTQPDVAVTESSRDADETETAEDRSEVGVHAHNENFDSACRSRSS